MKGEFLTVANGITVFRLVLLAVFVGLVMAEQRLAALWVFAAAWGLDAVDGWVARRWNEASELGSLLDKGVDRSILAVALLMFLLYEYVPWYAVFLATKDVILLPLFWQRRGRFWDSDWSVGTGGKLLTFLQGGGLVWVALGLPASQLVVSLVAFIGAVVGLQTIKREFKKPHQVGVGG